MEIIDLWIDTIKDSWVPTDPIDEVVTTAIILLIVVGPMSRYSAPGLWSHLSVVEYTSIFFILLPGGTVMVSLVLQNTILFKYDETYDVTK